MKRFAYTLSLVAATILAAAPLAAQSSNGPWWDPGRTQTRNGQQNGTVYGRNGQVYGQQQQQADGVWRADSRDRNGNTIYVRTRYDSNGNLVREYATRNIIGRYNVIDRQVLSDNNGQYGNRGTYDTRGTYDRRNGNDRNDRWDQNNGHDNGKHKGQYKNKNKNRGRNNDRDDDDR